MSFYQSAKLQLIFIFIRKPYRKAPLFLLFHEIIKKNTGAVRVVSLFFYSFAKRNVKPQSATLLSRQRERYGLSRKSNANFTDGITALRHWRSAQRDTILK